MERVKSKIKAIANRELRSLPSSSSKTLLDAASEEAIKGKEMASDVDYSVFKNWGTVQHKDALDKLLGKKLSTEDYLLLKHMVSNY
jgi:hypothetical protein